MTAIAYKKQMCLAKLLQVGAVFAALISLYLPWDQLDFYHSRGSTTTVKESRSTLFVLMAAALRLSYYFGEMSSWRYPVARLALLLSGFSFLLAPIYAPWLSQSNLLKRSWVALSTLLLAAFLIGWLRPEKSFSGLFMMLGTHKHTHFLSGYLFMWVALIFHFAGLLLIPSAKSSVRPVLPASD